MDFVTKFKEGIMSAICDRYFDSFSSSCLQRSLIDGTNILFILVFILISLINAVKKDSGSGNTGTRGRFFIIVSLCCTLTSFAHFAFVLWILLMEKSEDVQHYWLVHLVRGLMWVAIAISCHFRDRKGMRPLLLIWWTLFSLLASVFNVTMLVKAHKLQVLDAISWPVNLLLLFASWRLLSPSLVRKPQEEDPYKPLLEKHKRESNQISFISHLTFSWMNSLLHLGYSKPLTLSDVPQLEEEDGALKAYQLFAKEFEKQRNKRKSSKNLILRALIDCYWKEMLLVGVYALIRSTAVSVSPLILNSLVHYTSLKNRSLASGILLVGYMTVVKVAESLSQRYWYFYARRVGMRMRSALMAAVFQKQLWLSSLARKNHSAGEIVNYVAVDAYRLGEFPWWFHTAWTSPIQMSFAILILFCYAKWATLPGLIPVVLTTLSNFPYAKLMRVSNLFHGRSG